VAEIKKKGSANTKVAKFSDFTNTLKTLKPTGSTASSFNSPSAPAKFQNNSNFVQQYTIVDYNVYTIIGDDDKPFTACITIANVFWLKDILLGKKPMSDGQMLFWPSKMMYAPKVFDYMRNAGITDNSVSNFLRDTPTHRPLIIFSFASKIKSDKTFEEANSLLKTIIHGAVDDGSNTTPRKLFSLVIKTTPLSELQMAPLIAVSAIIGPVKPEFEPSESKFVDYTMPVYIDTIVANNEINDLNNNDDGDEDDDDDDDDDDNKEDNGAANGRND